MKATGNQVQPFSDRWRVFRLLTESLLVILTGNLRCTLLWSEKVELADVQMDLHHVNVFHLPWEQMGAMF